MNIPDICVLKFSASWCGPCKAISPYIEELKKEYPTVKVIEIDADENQELCKKYTITKLPSFVFLNKTEKKTIVGIDKTTLNLNFIRTYKAMNSNQIEMFDIPEDQTARVNVSNSKEK
tara:strand:+ start:205 stop:558 length:354 start_codon:yes stop_codon:yes gene_type:complete